MHGPWDVIIVRARMIDASLCPENNSAKNRALAPTRAKTHALRRIRGITSCFQLLFFAGTADVLGGQLLAGVAAGRSSNSASERANM
jgi:hypothetical protein